MIDQLRPYSAVKATGVDWLPAIPAHWQLRSLGSLVSARSGRNRGDLPLLSVVRELGVVPRAGMSREDNHNFVPEDLSNYKYVCEGDLVINKMKAWQGSLGVSAHEGIVSPAYFVYRTHFDEPRFGHALLRSKPYVAQFAAASDGVRIGQWDLDPQALKRIPVGVPPREEQDLIVRFLDWHWQLTVQLIKANRRLVGLLNQKKQSVTSGAGLIQEFRARLVADVVTGQLNVGDLASNLAELESLNLSGSQSGNVEGLIDEIDEIDEIEDEEAEAA